MCVAGLTSLHFPCWQVYVTYYARIIIIFRFLYISSIFLLPPYYSSHFFFSSDLYIGSASCVACGVVGFRCESSNVCTSMAWHVCIYVG